MTTIPQETNPEPNPYTEPVRGHITTLRTMSEQIDGYAEGPLADRRRINYSANVSDEALEELATSIEEADPASEEGLALARALRDAVAFTRAHLSLVANFDLKKAGVLYAIAKKRSDVTKLALHGYKIAKLLEQASDRTMPVPHVAHVQSIKRALKRRRKTKTEPTPPDTPATLKPL
jgi:hypothetical protein